MSTLMSDQERKQLCDLCGLNGGRHPFIRSFNAEQKNFCCLGCMNVYAILLESGVIAAGQDVRETEVFKRSLAMGLISNGDGQRAKDIGPPVSIPSDAPTQETLLQVSGMWCSACAWLIEHVLTRERGVVAAEAFFTSDLVKVKYCPQYLPPNRITERITELGYRVSEYNGENEGTNAVNAERRDLLLRIGIAGFLYLNIMTLSTALYVGYFETIADSVTRFLPLVLLALATPVVFYSAMPILRLAWRGLVNGVVRMETLLGLGILAAYAYSAFQAVRGLSGGGAHVYFDTASAIVTLVLAGKLIERNAKERTARAITMLYRMMPKKARLLAGGEERFVTTEALNTGDVFVVKAGERIPADGVVIEGRSHADESLLTGESTPVEKELGSRVVAGSLNAGNVIHVRATKVGGDTALAQIIGLVEHALGSKSELERTVDRISRIFVPGVIVLATLTFLVCWLGGISNSGEALMRAITILVIACPCALGMATPLAITAAIGRASRQGILVSDSRVLETIRKVDTVIFDKTGTMTEGAFALLEFTPLCSAEGAQSYAAAAQGLSIAQPMFTFRSFGKTHTALSGEISPRSASGDLQLVASLERYSEHPLAQAIVKHAESEGVDLLNAKEVEIRKGLGLTGNVAGLQVFAGNRRLMEVKGISIGDGIDQQAQQWQSLGYTVAFYGWEGKLRGLMAFGDRVKKDAPNVVADLKKRGIHTMLVSGDARETTAFVAATLGVDDFVAEALPNDKTTVIEQLQAQGQVVAMIGDGVNDAPALAQADLGIAIGSGTDIAMKAAAIVLMNNSLCKLPEVFELSHHTQRIVRQNLFWAFIYNSLGITLAVAGILTPIMAAGAMLLSSLSVIGNSLRLSRK